MREMISGFLMKYSYLIIGWWSGVNADGQSGLFPANYCELIEDDSAPAAHPQDQVAPEAELETEPATMHHSPPPPPPPPPAPSADAEGTIMIAAYE